MLIVEIDTGDATDEQIAQAFLRAYSHAEEDEKSPEAALAFAKRKIGDYVADIVGADIHTEAVKVAVASIIKPVIKEREAKAVDEAKAIAMEAEVIIEK